MTGREPIRDQLNRPLRDLRISVTDRCNFRCPYCMPAEIFGESYKFLNKDLILSFEEITRLARIIIRLGAVKLRLTGGEPLVRQNIEELVRQLAQLEGAEDMALTTNGVRLPLLASKLKQAGLRRVTVSLDSMDNDVFRRMNGNKADVADVLAGIAAAEAAGFAPIKINAVVQRGANDHTIVDLARYCKDRGLILRFIEYMDVGNRNGWTMDQVVPAREIVERIDAVMPLEALPRSYSSETALRYRYRDGGGEIGLIASVTMPFCGDCSRTRLSPEGMLYTCLFATQGTDLKTPMRAGASDDDLEAIIRGSWEARTDRYSEIRTRLTDSFHKIEMYYIGG
ncbi:MAG TPA: GTP 3',8-cyclase MoaA [Aggregatilineales bacterium]|nr:GTP 3',8-cyclase MoaA [Aggregatilineales bacterium]